METITAKQPLFKPAPGEVFGEVLFEKKVFVPKAFTVENDIVPTIGGISMDDLVYDAEQKFFYYPNSKGMKYFPSSINVFESYWNFLPIRHGGFEAKLQIVNVHRHGYTNKEIVDMSGQYFGTDDPELNPVSEIFNEYALGVVYRMMRDNSTCLDAYRNNGPCRILIPTSQNPQRCSRNDYHHPFITLEWGKVFITEEMQWDMYFYFKEKIPGLHPDIQLRGWQFGYVQGGFFWDPKDHVNEPPADFHMFVIS